MPVFVVFAVIYLGRTLDLNPRADFTSIDLGARFIFKGPIPVR